jgi:hypothetical protein
MSSSPSSGPQQVWTKEVRYENPVSVGHVIGYGGYNVRRWQTEYGCRIIVDDSRQMLVIMGSTEISVLKTTTEVQERVLVSWKYIDKETSQNDVDKDEYIDGINTIIREKHVEIDDLKSQLLEKDATIYNLNMDVCVDRPAVSKKKPFKYTWCGVEYTDNSPDFTWNC